MGEDRFREEVYDTEEDPWNVMYVNSPPGTNYGPYISFNQYESIRDVVTADYHSKIKRGMIINNNCAVLSSQTTHQGSGVAKNYVGSTLQWTGNGMMTANYAANKSLFSGFPRASNTSFSEAQLKLKALAYMDTTPYAFGEDTLELRQTLRLLRSPMQEIYKLARAYYKVGRKGRKVRKRYAETNFKFVKRIAKRELRLGEGVAKTTAGIFLQFQFAISPLVRSLTDALAAYSEVVPTNPPRLTARGIGDFQSSKTQAYVEGGIHFDLERTSDVSGKASILYRVTNPLYDWKYKLGFRAKDIPTTIWQVVPLSFMVDRVLDVSAFCKAVMNLTDPNVEILAASYRLKERHMQSYSMVDRDLAGFVVETPDKMVVNQGGYTRNVWAPSIFDAIPRPMPSGIIADATKIVELAALIIATVARE